MVTRNTDFNTWTRSPEPEPLDETCVSVRKVVSNYMS